MKKLEIRESKIIKGLIPIYEAFDVSLLELNKKVILAASKAKNLLIYKTEKEMYFIKPENEIHFLNAMYFEQVLKVKN